MTSTSLSLTIHFQTSGKSVSDCIITIYKMFTWCNTSGTFALLLFLLLTQNIPADILVHVGSKIIRFRNIGRPFHLPIFEITFNAQCNWNRIFFRFNLTHKPDVSPDANRFATTWLLWKETWKRYSLVSMRYVAWCSKFVSYKPQSFRRNKRRV